MLEGKDAWVKAFGLLVTFMSVRAAFEAIRASEGTLPEGEDIFLLRAINVKLGRLAGSGPEDEDEEVVEIAGLDYYEIL